MAGLAEIYIKRETLRTLLDVVSKKDEKGIAITLSINDDSNQWGQNVSGYVAQTKEQREAKKDKFFVANGKVFWTNGEMKKGVKEEEQTAAPSAQKEEDDGLPF